MTLAELSDVDCKYPGDVSVLTLCCHVDASHPQKVLRDLHEQILEMQTTSLAPTDEFEL